MQLSELQKQIMQLGADKSLSFGCIVCITDTYYDAKQNKETNIGERLFVIGKETIQGDYIVRNGICKNKIIYNYGQPITYSRLCYLRHTDKKPEVIIEGVKSKLEKWINVCFAFESNPELYNQSILEWDSVTQTKVRDFLLLIS